MAPSLEPSQIHLASLDELAPGSRAVGRVWVGRDVGSRGASGVGLLVVVEVLVVVVVLVVVEVVVLVLVVV